MSTSLVKAQLQQLDEKFNKVDGGKEVPVQFNPETLKVSFSNQLATPANAGDQKGSAARQFVGAGTTKLSLQLWFDVTVPGSKSVDDVRKLTQEVAFFITPLKDKKDATKLIPPGVRFLWGSFQFDGLMDSLEESLEFFSSEGRPLRASMTLNLSQQRIQFLFGDAARAAQAAGQGQGGTTPGTRPLTQAPAGSTLQGLVANQGRGGDWQSVAAANNIENPRLLDPGQLIDLNASTPKLTLNVGATINAGAALSAGLNLSTGGI
ncbi:MAG: peptidoglycan-binding protein, partial [Ktedonobacteraceae bacterium]|jgi:hypothetical protein